MKKQKRICYILILVGVAFILKSFKSSDSVALIIIGLFIMCISLLRLYLFNRIDEELK